MKTAYILHGVCDEDEYYSMHFPSPSNAHWLPWLQQKFLRAGYLCQCLEMPNPPAAKYDEWLNAFKHAQLDQNSIVVGHSAGCGFFLKYLSQHPNIKISQLVLVAPWLDPFKKMGDFLQFQLDKSIDDRLESIHLLYSEDEPVKGVKETKDKIVSTYPKTKLHTYADKGHFCLSDTGYEFEDLWDIIDLD